METYLTVGNWDGSSFSTDGLFSDLNATTGNTVLINDVRLDYPNIRGVEGYSSYSIIRKENEEVVSLVQGDDPAEIIRLYEVEEGQNQPDVQEAKLVGSEGADVEEGQEAQSVARLSDSELEVENSAEQELSNKEEDDDAGEQPQQVEVADMRAVVVSEANDMLPAVMETITYGVNTVLTTTIVPTACGIYPVPMMILKTGSSGGKWLHAMLNSQPSVFLKKDAIGSQYGETPIQWTEYMRRCLLEPTGPGADKVDAPLKVVGFMGNPSNCHSGCDIRTVSSSVGRPPMVVVLVRSNAVKAAVASVRAKELKKKCGTSPVSLVSECVAYRSTKIDAQALLWAASKHLRDTRVLLREAEAAAGGMQRVSVVLYEELQEEPVMVSMTLMHAVGVHSFTEPPVEQEYVKTTREDLSLVIKNYEEVEVLFQGYPCLHRMLTSKIVEVFPLCLEGPLAYNDPPVPSTYYASPQQRRLLFKELVLTTKPGVKPRLVLLHRPLSGSGWLSALLNAQKGVYLAEETFSVSQMLRDVSGEKRLEKFTQALQYSTIPQQYKSAAVIGMTVDSIVTQNTQLAEIVKLTATEVAVVLRTNIVHSAIDSLRTEQLPTCYARLPLDLFVNTDGGRGQCRAFATLSPSVTVLMARIRALTIANMDMLQDATRVAGTAGDFTLIPLEEFRRDPNAVTKELVQMLGAKYNSKKKIITGVGAVADMRTILRNYDQVELALSPLPFLLEQLRDSGERVFPLTSLADLHCSAMTDCADIPDFLCVCDSPSPFVMSLS